MDIFYIYERLCFKRLQITGNDLKIFKILSKLNKVDLRFSNFNSNFHIFLVIIELFSILQNRHLFKETTN